jgi:outer membrane receptor for ferrienterochelin and colicins
VTLVGGAAIQQESYRAEDVSGFDYTFTAPALFAQTDVDAASWLSLSASVRLDAHSEYGSELNPILSLLFRGPTEGAFGGWTSRLSVGGGEFAPTPFTEETEATGLSPLTPLWPATAVAPVVPLPKLVAERATSGSLDVGGPVETAIGRLELNATGFASRVRHPLQVVDAGGTSASGASFIRLVNAPDATRTWGLELLGRLVRALGESSADGEEAPALRVTGTYTYIRSTGCDPDAGTTVCERREVPLTPRHAAGVVAAMEQHDRGRVGLEVYYTGRQRLDENPYRTESRPYVVLGLLGERAFETTAGTARVFVNLENLTNVRQTRYDPLVLPARGRGGRWTTDAWTELAGFTVNGGVRFAF